MKGPLEVGPLRWVLTPTQGPPLGSLPHKNGSFFLVEANLCGGLLWSVVFKWGPPQWGPLEWGLVERGTFERGPP